MSITQTDQRSKLRKSMMGLLARREHSRLELFQKMQLKNFDSDLINLNLDDFSEHDWQSDDRYAAMLVRSRILKFHGPVKLKMELKSKGVENDIIYRCMDSDVDWKVLATTAAFKKFPLGLTTQSEVNKCYRFLLQRGFTNEQVHSAIQSQKSNTRTHTERSTL